MSIKITRKAITKILYENIRLVNIILFVGPIGSAIILIWDSMTTTYSIFGIAYIIASFAISLFVHTFRKDMVKMAKKEREAFMGKFEEELTDKEREILETKEHMLETAAEIRRLKIDLLKNYEKIEKLASDPELLSELRRIKENKDKELTEDYKET